MRSGQHDAYPEETLETRGGDAPTFSPDFDQIKRWAVIEMGLEDMHITCFRIGPVQEFGLDCPCICILVDYVSV